MKDIKNYEGIYGITEDGQIWSYRSNRFLKNKSRKASNPTIELNYNGIAKTFLVWKLVYSTYKEIDLSILDNYKVVYKDNNKNNNNIENLLIKKIKGFELDQEIKIIPDFEDYGATKNGQIWSFKTQKFLAPNKKDNDELVVSLYKEGQCYYKLVHRLVLSTWSPVDNWEEMQINHKDENRLNNKLENLEWCDASYNINYGTRNARTREKLNKKVKCVETGQVFNSQEEVRIFLGQKSSSNISNCLSGRQETCGGYHWERVQEGE